jgi:2-polyprenyl-6-methoxyphenol hydroxylase-like FAD-dependent oxidoreductase
LRTENFGCCVVGGGPAGVMTGLLLARAGVDVLVLEKYPDFIRDFRGDTVHPSTLRVMEELGYVDDFLRLPHRKVSIINVTTPAGTADFADFSRIGGRFPYVAFMPQWDLLDFLAEKAQSYPTFQLMQKCEAIDLVTRDNQVVGVRAQADDGPLEVRASLVIAADGRHSTMREAAGLPVASSKSPIDVVWFRLCREEGEEASFLYTGTGFVLICIDRGDYWQMAYVIPQGGYEQVRAEGLDRLWNDVASVRPELADRMRKEVDEWDDLKLLKVRVDRLRTWHRPGLLCIGDAAHAMSPAGGVGINLAIQDAVAAARMLAPVLIAGRTPTERQLHRVQRRRAFPTRVVQAAQVDMLSDIYPKTRSSRVKRPLVAKIVQRIPPLSGLAARFIGVGIRPEHVDP